MAFEKATKAKARLRLAIDGPSGSGKTYTALLIAEEVAKARGGRVAVVDTERGSASKYADRFDFDTLELLDFDPRRYIAAIHEAEESGNYAAVVLDSISHAWDGKGGLLEQHDNATARQKTQNSYTAWRDITPIQQEFVDAMLQSPLDVIVTMRSKMEYVQEKDERTGKTEIRKVGLAPVQRGGIEYEFDIVGDIDVQHTLVVSKSRCAEIADAVVRKPDAKFAAQVIGWLMDGSERAATPRRTTSPTPTAPSLAPAPAPSSSRPASVPQPLPRASAQSGGPQAGDHQSEAPSTSGRPPAGDRQRIHSETPPRRGSDISTAAQRGLIFSRAKKVFGEQNYGLLLDGFLEAKGLPVNVSEMAKNEASWLIEELLAMPLFQNDKPPEASPQLPYNEEVEVWPDDAPPDHNEPVPF